MVLPQDHTPSGDGEPEHDTDNTPPEPVTLELVLDGSLGVSPEGDQYVAVLRGDRLPVTPDEHVQFMVGQGPWENKYRKREAEL